MMTQEELAAFAALKKSLDDILEINRLEFLYDQMRYLGVKVRAGQAHSEKASFFTNIAPGATFQAFIPNDTGFVWQAHFISCRFDQDGVIESVINVDGIITPWVWMPLSYDLDVSVTATIPYDMVAKESNLITLINHDIIAHWAAVFWMGTSVRKDVWEADSALMNEAAQRYEIHKHTA